MSGRWTAQIDGDFVVFLIGARFNSKWQAFRAIADLGGRRGMGHMLMPPHGLGKATSLVPLSEASSARQRLRNAVRA
jgi:hypothetical protein